MDGLGGGGGGLAGAGAGPPRLLVPVILAAGANRWNTLGAPAHGGFELLLLPMLVGFFTYKVAVVGRQGMGVLGDLSREAGRGK